MKNFRSYRLWLSLLIAVALLGGLSAPGSASFAPLATTTDFGDAPDSTNYFGAVMQAYPGVNGRFPTAFGTGSLPYGPKHQNSTLRFYLGDKITAEEGADFGFDSDGVFNIDPPADQADQDQGDDGLILPSELPHCQRIRLRYIVTVPNTVSTPVDAYTNLWMDWNRDGSWAQRNAAPARCGELLYAPEWAVKNYAIHLDGSGVYTLTTPAFYVWNARPDLDLWARLTVSEVPATSTEGAGPPTGWLFGETEDYRIPGVVLDVLLPPPDPLPPVGPPVITGEVYDFEVTGIEISQAIQNLDNDMPLVEGRRTYVRVYAREKNGYTVNGVTAALQVTGNEVFEGGGGGFAFNVYSPPTTVYPDGGDRLNYEDSFNFELPWGIDFSGVGVVSFQANVNWDHSKSENNFANNLSEEVIRPMYQPNPLKMYFVPTHLHDPAPDEDTEVDPASPIHEHHFMDGAKDWQIAYNAMRVHPIAGGMVSDEGFIVDWTNLPVYPIDHGSGVEWNLRRGADRTAINERIAVLKALSNDPYTIFYGMIHAQGIAGSFSGWANKGVAWGVFNTSVSASSPWRLSSGNTLAHEAGHRRGLAHMLCAGNEASGGGVDPDYPWPKTDTSPCSLAAISPFGYYGLDVYHTNMQLPDPIVISNDPAQAQPNRGLPLMGYKSPQWISPYEYCKMMPKYGMPCDIDWTLDLTWFLEDLPFWQNYIEDAPQEYLWVSGLLNMTRNEAVFSPFYRMAKPSAGLIDEALQRRWLEAESGKTSEYEITIEDASGNTLYSLPLHSETHGHSPDDEQDPDPGDAVMALSDLVPLPENAQKVVLKHGSDIMLEKSFSKNAPTVQLLSPNGGENLEIGDQIEWQGSDLDGDPLHYTLSYSNDGGSRWSALLLETQLTNIVIDETFLSSLAGSDQARLKIIVSDGANTAEDISDAVFFTPNNAPQAVILLPANQASFQHGQQVTLSGAALDKEDGAIGDAGMTWSSDLDGSLGSGHELKLTDLSPGTHLISLTVTDSGGEQHTASLSITIQPPLIYLPLVVR